MQKTDYLLSVTYATSISRKRRNDTGYLSRSGSVTKSHVTYTVKRPRIYPISFSASISKVWRVYRGPRICFFFPRAAFSRPSPNCSSAKQRHFAFSLQQKETTSRWFLFDTLRARYTKWGCAIAWESWRMLVMRSLTRKRYEINWNLSITTTQRTRTRVINFGYVIQFYRFSSKTNVRAVSYVIRVYRPGLRRFNPLIHVCKGGNEWTTADRAHVLPR